jgi:hypothetical protein
MVTYGNDVGNTHYSSEYTRSYDNAPQWHTHAFFTGCALVQIPQNVETQDEH